jgi:hypothetical protein
MMKLFAGGDVRKEFINDQSLTDYQKNVVEERRNTVT